MLGKFLFSAIALVTLSCDARDRCLDRGGSFNYQIGECDPDRSQPGPESPCLHNILGAWQIARHQAPGISALSREESDTWIGKRGIYEIRRVAFDGEICAEPTYSSRVITPAQFSDSFRFSPSSLGLPRQSICITEVGCPQDWAAPGSLLIHSSETLMATWDGVFFELERE